LHDSSEKAVKDYLLKKDTLTMTEDGLLKVFNGQTTIDEVIRVTKG
jgi:type II secretory ATPase GspE/PulE/Tfp pilus assembly ATPase PilB-like protein